LTLCAAKVKERTFAEYGAFTHVTDERKIDGMKNVVGSAAGRARAALIEFLKLESASGLILIMAALIALIFANSPLASGYQAVLGYKIGISNDLIALRKPILLWINDGLMALFFLVVALEIKREMISGHLADRRTLVLPVFAAIGGMAIPALIYVSINMGSPDTLRGWAIPAATDIAFALGIMALLGSRVPIALKILLTAIAIIDDLGAIIIIALFYTDTLATLPLLLSFVALLGLVALNRFGVTRALPYIVLGFFMWLCVLKSGVHATLAGVALGLCIPTQGDKPLLSRMEHALHPWVAYGVLPIFAFTNAGLNLSTLSLSDFGQPIPSGIVHGLFLGKQLGIFGFILLLFKLRLVPLPADCTLLHIYGMALLSGIGFTMSLFIGGLAFDDPVLLNQVRLGVLSGSVLSAVCGLLVLRFAGRARV
jgi:Na+:H+ antiporter, NhaA family